MRRGAGQGRAGRDAGLTLIELVVTMSLMTVFMGMFTGAVLQMFHAAGANEALSIARSELNIVFLRLDKEIRYAAGISDPGPVGADVYVEFQTTNTGTAVCTELRLHAATEQLQRRTWPQGAGPVAPTAWTPLASRVRSTQPFTTSAADGTYGFQRLGLRLTADSGSRDEVKSTEMAITFTASNTSFGTSSEATCAEGRSIP